ncbi:MAG TPA: universal stress protein [Chitinophagaceae bacterium]|nr:universal stress protein [Chitinophagaceae bacterium]
MKTIIVPTDFSPAATNALNYAADMAKEINASMMLLHVYQVPVSMSEVPAVLISANALKTSSESKLKELKKAVEHITSGKIKIYTEARDGNVIDEIEKLCERINPFAVVMGTTGTSSIERIFFGSTALNAIRNLTRPVIVVPPGKEFGKGVKKIGFACDFRQVVESTPVQFIRQVVKEFNAELHVLNVDFKNKEFGPETPEQSLLLHEMLKNLEPVYHFIEHADIEDGINEFAEKNNLDLVIAIPKKQKLFEGIFKSSSTKQLVMQSRIPVMCIHEE